MKYWLRLLLFVAHLLQNPLNFYPNQLFDEINMSRIHTDHNGVAVNAISALSDGKDVEGHVYYVLVGPKTVAIEFQQGGVDKNGVNGLTNEALLAILIHRTKHLNKVFPCDENFRAISHMEEALVNFEVRSARRIVRGVEGKEVV